MAEELRLSYESPQISGDRIKWFGTMTASDVDSRIFFDFSYPNISKFQPTIRPFLLAYLVPAMRLGRPLRLSQPIDASTYQNLMEWQETFASLIPKRLKVVPIRGEITRDIPRLVQGDRQSLTTFSGGVDSCFTALRHAGKTIDAHPDPTYRRSRLAAGLMVHGFDIPLNQSDIFESAWARSKRMLESWGATALRMRTNLRSLNVEFDCDWGNEAHGIWLAAVLSCYESCYDTFLIPSTYAHPALSMPWGSNAITDPLFSSGSATYWHDGAAYNKLEKVRGIAHDLSVQRNLRVCWQGAQLDRNCGHCFKCVATQLCFLVSGHAEPDCFERPYTNADIAKVHLRTPPNRWLFQQLRQEAKAQNHQSVVRSLNRMFARQFFLDFSPRKILKKILKSLGLRAT